MNVSTSCHYRYWGETGNKSSSVSEIACKTDDIKLPRFVVTSKNFHFTPVLEVKSVNHEDK